MANTWSTSRVPNTMPDDSHRMKVAKIAIVAPAAADRRTGILMSSNPPAQLDLPRSRSAANRPRGCRRARERGIVRTSPQQASAIQTSKGASNAVA